MHARSRLIAATGAVTLLTTAVLSPTTAGAADRHSERTRYALDTVTALDGARGVDALGRGRTLVTEADGTFSLVTERRRGGVRVRELGSVPAGGIAPAIAAGKRGLVYVLTAAGEPGTGASTLYGWRRGWDAPRALADIAAYQETDPDPANQEGVPEESNPFGLAVLADGSAVVADAANNDVLRVSPRGRITTLARLMPRTVEVPEGLPPTDPDGNPLPPAGAEVLAEAVATSVAVGPRGEIYVGELRGFPATPGTSRVWRIRPGARDATCGDPVAAAADRARAHRPSKHSKHSKHSKPSKHRACTLHADGLTSVVGLAADRAGTVWATSLSTQSWLQWELGTPGAEIGGLFRIDRRHRGGTRVTELFAGQIPLPGDVDTTGRDVYLVAPSFGPGNLWKATPQRSRR